MFEIDVDLEQARELFKKKLKVDFDKLKIKLPRSVPGQWIQFKSSEMKLLGYYSYKSDSNKNHYLRFCGAGVNPSAYIDTKLKELIEAKKEFWGEDQCGRLIHGESDGFPGLVLDKYKNCAIIKYEDVGFDPWREKFIKIISDQYQIQLFVQEDDEKRLNQGMPSFGELKITKDIETNENGIQFIIEKEIVQKAGFYHDHKINRLKMLKILKATQMSKTKGLDLFSYVGGWGMHMLNSGVDHVEFVDQGQLNGSIEKTLNVNNWNGRGSYIRSDVFAFLERSINEKKKYQVICCDPPAFAKSKQQVDAAKKGYSRLIELVSKVAEDKGYLFFGSCTHYIDILELDSIIRNKMNAQLFSLMLLDIGVLN
jgi:23S rRNA (cytosine1962-C5)-methyltransferase